MKQSLRIRTRNEKNWSTKISMLNHRVSVLLNEVKRLEAMPLADVSQGVDLGEELRRFEIHLIQLALEETGGHQVNAAELLGIKKSSLHAKIKRYEIKPRWGTDSTRAEH